VNAGIIAAGQGERLRAVASGRPKPLVAVAGKALIEHTLDSIRAAGGRRVVCIINRESAEVETHCRARVSDLELEFVHKTTPSSMESLFALAPKLGGDPFLVLTVDAIVAPSAVRGFAAAAARRPHADAVLAVNDFIDDERPLFVACAPDGRIEAIGADAAASPLVTAGFYVFRPSVFAEIEAARAQRFTALRQFLHHLLVRGYTLFAERVPKCVDVDRPEDVAVAEAFIRSGYAA
jgi:NDP-sugar pyrophosphorylase family protein